MNIRKFRSILVGALALLGLLSGEALAQASSATVTVSAVVPKACRFYTASSSMTIQHSGGLIDPVSSSPATGSTTLNYRCSNGDSPRFEIDQTTAFASPKTRTVTLTGVPSGTMPADITVTATGGPGTGLGSGQDKTATIDGSIAVADFQAAAPGTYSKSVTIHIEATP